MEADPLKFGICMGAYQGVGVCPGHYGICEIRTLVIRI